MSPIHVLVVRDDASSGMNPNMLNLIIALVALMGAGFSLGLGFYLLRRMRSSRGSRQSRDLEIYQDNEKPVRSITHRGLTYLSSKPHKQPSLVIQERLDLINNSNAPPSSPIPEIRITFPDEVDSQGKRQSGRVVVVKVGETSVGLEPFRDEKCPPYQPVEGDRFQSLDLERMGGLKEGVQPKRFM